MSLEAMPNRLKRLAEKLEMYDSVQRWKLKVYTKKSRSHHTLLSYYYCLKKFCEFTGLNPDQMVEEYRKAIEAKSRSEFESKIDAFIATYLERNKVPQGSLSKRNLRKTRGATFKLEPRCRRMRNSRQCMNEAASTYAINSFSPF